jgi:hypothetical protein
MYDPGTKVTTFTKAQLNPLKTLLAKVDAQLWYPAKRIGKQARATKQIMAGGSLSLRLPNGTNSVRQLVFTLTESDPKKYAQALRSTILKITFDGEQTVWCPLGDFSGSGVGGKPIQSWYRTVDSNGQIVSRWVMPYRSTAKLTLANTGKTPVNISVTATTGGWQWTNRSLYFYTGWKQSREVTITHEEDKVKDWNMSTISGKGIYLGNTLAVYNHMHTWYGEGDQKIWVDKDKFPSEFGTGLEDYYNTSWAPVVLYQTPFANAPRADNVDSFGYNTFTRTRILDGVPFSNNFRMDLEMLGWKSGKADFAVTTYWYGFKGAAFKAENMATEAGTTLP